MLPCWRGAARLAVLSLVLPSTWTVRGRADEGDGSAPSSSSAATPRRTVVLRVVGARDEDALEDTIRELLARLSVAVVVSRGSSPDTEVPDALGRVAIDLSSSADAVLLVTDGRTGDVRLRRTIPRDASPAILREEIAHAVQSAVEAELLSEKDPAAQPPTPPAPAPAPPPVTLPPALPPALATPPVVREQPQSASGRSPFGLDLTTLGGVGPIASGSGPSARIGAGLVGMAHAPLRMSLALTFLYAWPFDAGSSEISSHTSIVSVRAVPSIEIFHTSWIALDLGAGAGVDVMTVDPRSDLLPAANLGSSTTRADAILSGVASAHVAITSGVVFLVAAACDVDLASRQYVLAQGSADSEVLAPWRVRPMILAGFGFTALGEGHFASGGGGR